MPAIIAGIPALVIVALLLGAVWIAFQTSFTDSHLTLANFRSLFADEFAARAFVNTLGFSFFTLIFAFLFGVPIAWITERTDIRGRSVIYILMTVGIFIPSFFVAMGWLFLLHPRIGVINTLARNMFNLAQPPFSIIGIPGMGLVQGLGLASVVFLLTSASFRSMDARLEEAALMSGANWRTVLRRVTLPLAWPGLLAAGLYVFTIAIGAFDVPLIIGLTNRIYTFSTFLYVMSNPLNGLPRYEIVAAFAVFMIGLALMLSWIYMRVLISSRRYQTVSGKAFQPRLTHLGSYKWAAWCFIGFYFTISKILPLVTMIWASFLPYFQPPSFAALQSLSLSNYMRLDWSLIGTGLKNTLVLMLAAPALSLAASLLFSWVVLRGRSRFRFAFDFVAFLPHAVPSSIFAFVALVFAMSGFLDWANLSDSLLLVVMIMAITSLSFGSRITNGALIQLHPELEEAAAMAGASAMTVVRRIIIPLLRPTLMFGWLWMALIVFRELTIPMVLFAPDNITFSVVAWSLWNGGSLPAAAAVNLLMLLGITPFVVAYLHYTARARLS